MFDLFLVSTILYKTKKWREKITYKGNHTLREKGKEGERTSHRRESTYERDRDYDNIAKAK